MDGFEHDVIEVKNEADLIRSLQVKDGDDNKDDNDVIVVSTKLETDERVIARITDGIYRQPGSALRELISNAYDADATEVVIKTNAPRFDRIEVRDNGQGMSLETLTHLLFHIGGSSKRNAEGIELGVTSKFNSSMSPNGRKLIGKIGIGLFSVSQLTRKFQIITKTKGSPYRTIATVVLKQYFDGDSTSETGSDEKFEAGRVNVWRERAEDILSHGTTIVLNNIHVQARDTLRSTNIWSFIDQEGQSSQDLLAGLESTKDAPKPPKYHIGRLDSEGGYKGADGSLYQVPWEPGDQPDVAFEKLVDSVWCEVNKANSNPKLDVLFDNYLQMIWQLSLSVPLPYVGGHPFDLQLNGWGRGFLLSNKPRGAAEEISLGDKRTVRDILGLKNPGSSFDEFNVFVDDLKLARPIRFKDLPATKTSLTYPLLFLGKYREEFKGHKREFSGGTLDFEAYLLWTPKVAPTEHQGVLVRVYDASGTLFDSTFMRYQVSEQTRLKQIVCEIFVSEGLDSALNIDRESFNIAHPHAVLISRWLHNALRQLATAQKRLGKEVLDRNKLEEKGAISNNIRQVVERAWERRVDDPASSPPEIEFCNAGELQSSLFNNACRFELASLDKYPKRLTDPYKEKLVAIAQILVAYGMLEALSDSHQSELLDAVFEIITELGE